MPISVIQIDENLSLMENKHTNKYINIYTNINTHRFTLKCSENKNNGVYP